MSISGRDFFIVSYDITDDKRRLKVANVLEDYGDRVQFSVFEVFVSEKSKNRMLERIKRIVDKDNDSVRIYFLCRACLSKLEILGIGMRPDDPEVIIV